MGQIVLGLGTSHTPQMSTPPEMWALHAARDRAMDSLYYRGRSFSYDDLEQVIGNDFPGIVGELRPSVWSEKHARCDAATARLSDALRSAAPDVVVIVSNDHKEMFEERVPELAVYSGDPVTSIPTPPDKVPESVRPALWARQKDHPEDYPCAPELAREVIGSLAQAGFDVTDVRSQPAGRSIGHGFTHVRLRLMDTLRPILPVIINSYYPPNQPNAQRCLELGRALRKALETAPGDQRFCVVASGGLSHFVVDEQFDRKVLRALEERDEKTLSAIQDSELMQGTAETRHWIVAGGALEGLKMRTVDYVPAYRSAAATGCGTAFTIWQ